MDVGEAELAAARALRPNSAGEQVEVLGLEAAALTPSGLIPQTPPP